MRTRLGKIELELRLVPVGGFVWIKADRNTPRPRLIAFMLGGVAANAALLGVTVWLSHTAAPQSASEASLIGFGMAQLSLITMTVIPVWGRVLGIRFANDGLQVLLLMRGRHSLDVHRTYEELLARYAPGRAPRITPRASCASRSPAAVYGSIRAPAAGCSRRRRPSLAGP